MKEGYLPLYRKYRPQKLDDVVGQSHIKRALTNAIQLNKISHAYLFTGPRGTGKTSTARILAKSLNCIDGPTVTPCGECESCKSITNSVPIDVIELDAASNRSVDDAHEILEKVNYAPIHGKYKIYIIDEVHMLTVQAFNALLKTLEEPPKNVIFILATTESHKVLDTIKSRCQRFDFKRITTNDIIEHLKKISKLENIKISDSAIALIAKSSAGGMRDSLALLDQVSTLGNENEITEEDINSLLGRLSFDALLELTTHIVKSDGASAIQKLEDIYNNGNEPLQILKNLMLFFKNILITKTCDTKYAVDLTGLAEERLNELKQITNSLEKHQIIFLINKTADYIKILKDTTNQQMWLEVALIDLSNLSDNTKLLELEERLSRLEGGEVTPAATPVVLPVKAPAPVNNQPQQQETAISEKSEVSKNTKESILHEKVKEEKTEIQEKEVKPVTKISSVMNLDTLWSQILQVLLKDNLSGFAQMKAFTSLIKCDEESITIVCKTPTFTEKLNAPDKKSKLVDAIHTIIGKTSTPVIIRARTPDDAKIGKVKLNKPTPKQVPAKELIDNSDMVDDEEKKTLNDAVTEEKNNQTSNEGLSDQTNMVINLFDGKIIE